ncbi:1-acyl-sn-glycerol-3-phosphate acyltransferase [Deinococcus sp. YIM 77859]|uniref:1-acyl-sn-glycerol-3-phosphate acyltransferase n=1 Tax=Deinococcus sp. YIM 77859 TaxID=1540221 RepID=UPI000AE1F399|nr:1-acyl-sn-glycerol-3-phosphate acyltransferase [Deinococcus sp. YIM 77859]
MSAPDPAAALLRATIRRSVRRGLGGVWLRGPLPPAGAVLAPNHHTWWDGYVLGEVAWTMGAEFRVLMTGQQLARFPFLRRVGALGAAELRAAVRAARSGAWVVVFPEGAIFPAGPLHALHPGAGWLARRANVPLIPVALRVVLRGGQFPEAYVRCGRATEPTRLREALARELAVLDTELSASDPHSPLAGYLRVTGGRTSDAERLHLPGRLLARLTGDRP